jgi:two-component system sensor histidine kinase RpfC
MKFGGTAIDLATADFTKQGANEADLSDSSAPMPVVLLAEDNRIVCKVIVKLLQASQVRIRHVTQGEAALDVLMTEDIALALIDTNLPAMSGLEVAKLYRFAAVGRKHVPILGFIGAGTAEQIGACIDAGMDGCLAKPVDPTQLIGAVRSFVGAHSEAGAASAAGGANVRALAMPNAAMGPTETARSVEPAAINLGVLKDLEQLGGHQFVEDVVSQFVTDAGRVFPELNAAVRDTDVQASRDLLHALRSCAANVGADSIFEICLHWREIDRDELVEHGEACLARLQTAFDEACLSIREYESSKRAA